MSTERSFLTEDEARDYAYAHNIAESYELTTQNEDGTERTYRDDNIVQRGVAWTILDENKRPDAAPIAVADTPAISEPDPVVIPPAVADAANADASTHGGA